MLVQLTDGQKQLIQKHLDLMLEANETINLTRVTSEEEARVLHVDRAEKRSSSTLLPRR